MPRDTKQVKARKPLETYVEPHMVLWHVPFALLVIIGLGYLLVSNNRQDVKINEQEKEIAKLSTASTKNNDNFDNWGAKQANVVMTYTGSGPAYAAYSGKNPDYIYYQADPRSYVDWYLTSDKSQAYIFKWDENALANDIAKHFYGKLQKIKGEK